jgi:hypothetical protein
MKFRKHLLAIVLLIPPLTALAQSDGQKSFAQMKTLAGTWDGRVTTVPLHPEMEGSSGQVIFRVTSMGNALLHEMKAPGRPDDPITMLYLDGDRLLLTHYCDAGNRPRMVAKMSPNGKSVGFDFLDMAGSAEYGHMQSAVFTFIDADHHTEDWTFMEPGDKPLHAHLDLRRARSPNPLQEPSGGRR